MYKQAMLVAPFLLSAVCQNAYSQQVADPGYRQMNPLELRVNSLCKDIAENGKTTDKLTANDFAELPLGIARKSGSVTYVIAIDSAYSEERGWFFSAYSSITLPGTTQPLAFAAKNIAFNAGGLTSSSQVKLLLVSTIKVKINDNISMILPGDGKNFIEWDCNGFKSINLKGDFIFSDTFIEPDSALAAGATSVRAGFEINTKDINDILLSVSITPFKLSGVDELSFEIKNAVADFSDIVNPTGFSFPAEYQQTFGADIKLWRGFFIQDAIIHFNSFANADKKPTLFAKNFLIDDLGVSGTVGGTNLISLKEGSAGGWPISIDQVSVKFLLNRVTGGSLAGNLNIPLLGEDPVPYAAEMEQVENQLNYKFSVATNDDSKKFRSPLGSITLGKGSVISIERRKGKWLPSTLLNGFIDVNASPLVAEGIKFEKLGLTTEMPYITSGVFSTVTGKKSTTANFPIRIDSVHLGIYRGEASLGFAVALNFMNSQDKGFAASTYVQLLAKMYETPTSEKNTNKKQEWKLEKVKVNDVSLDCNVLAITLKGSLSIYDKDPVYGSGFRGNVLFNIAKLLGNGVKVNAYFGSKEAFRYWHIDVLIPLPEPGIPLVPGVLKIDGIIGGASYNMSRQKPFVPDFSNLGTTKKIKEDAAQPLTYIPDQKTALAFIAGVTLSSASKKVFNGDAILEVAFNGGGGLRYVNFSGSAFFITDVEERERGQTATGAIYANLNMLYDTENSTFHANLKTYVNIAGGLIRGIGPSNLVGEAVIHADPRDWYIYIGRASQMVGINLAGLAEARMYFMIGTQVEDIPPPPPEVREIFGQIDPSLMRDGNLLKRGRGFATGVHFKVGYDSKNDLKPFYIVLMVGAGADVMIRDYGDQQCNGSGQIGINGWYASGQAYVFLIGKVGVFDFDIVSLGAAALLQAKLPNPSWLKGQLAGRYKILGGLISGSFDLGFTVGEQCEILNPGTELGDIKVIESLKPDDGGKDVSVFSATQVSFNTSMETEFAMANIDNKVNTYRIRLQEFTLTKSGTPVQTSLVWNASKDVAILKTHEILPPESELKATVKIYWEKKVNGGNWEALKKGNQVNYEIKEATFSTGEAPNYIPEENVAYSHPTKNQYHFHRDENRTGYLKLTMGQEYLFKQGEGAQWDFMARFQGPNSSIEVPLTYNASESMATFAIPQNLPLRTVYKFSFVKKPKAGAIDQNLKRTEVKKETGQNSEVNVASNSLEGTITQSVDKDIYTSAFRTSQFGKFEEKINSLANTNDQFDVAIGNVAVIGQRGNMPEVFDELELKGRDIDSQPLVQVIASPNNVWLKDKISPWLYDPYASFGNGVEIKWRKPEELGIKPLKGVTLINDMGNFKLQESNVTSLTAPVRSGTVLIGYYLSYYSYWDFNELSNQAARLSISNKSSAPIKTLLASNYVDLLRGSYPVDIRYFLPGAKEPSYTKTIQIQF
jgi:hypothetical protein